MSAEQIPGTLRVQCKCGWQGTTEDLRDKTCPICGEAFKAWPEQRRYGTSDADRETKERHDRIFKKSFEETKAAMEGKHRA